MRLDPSTRRSLELSQNLADGSRRNTVLEVLDQTVTSMGARMLRRWIEQPLLDRARIEARNGAVARLADHVLARGDLRDALKKVADIERLVSRCATGTATPRDLAGLRQSLLALPEVLMPWRECSVTRSLVILEDYWTAWNLSRRPTRSTTAPGRLLWPAS